MPGKGISYGERIVRVGDDDASVAQWCASLSRRFSANKLIFLVLEFRNLKLAEYLVQIECIVHTVQKLIAGRVILVFRLFWTLVHILVWLPSC